MKCNLPKGYKSSISEEVAFDQPTQYSIKRMPQIDRRNTPMGYNGSSMMAYGTGKNYNFTTNARSRKNAQVRNNRNAMTGARMSESERSFQRIAQKCNSDAQEM